MRAVTGKPRSVPGRVLSEEASLLGMALRRGKSWSVPGWVLSCLQSCGKLYSSPAGILLLREPSALRLLAGNCKREFMKRSH